MSRKKKPRRRAAPPAHGPQDTGENRTADAATVAWTVSVTTVLMCDIAAVMAHLYARSKPEARSAMLFGEMVLFAAAAIGALSILLLPVLYRVRRIPPPQGLVVFGACAAAAPLLAILLRATQ